MVEDAYMSRFLGLGGFQRLGLTMNRVGSLAGSMIVDVATAMLPACFFFISSHTTSRGAGVSALLARLEFYCNEQIAFSNYLSIHLTFRSTIYLPTSGDTCGGARRLEMMFIWRWRVPNLNSTVKTT